MSKRSRIWLPLALAVTTGGSALAQKPAASPAAGGAAAAPTPTLSLSNVPSPYGDRPTRGLSLREALELAHKNNRDLAQAKARIAEAHAAVTQAWAALLPQVSLQGKYTHNYKEVTLDTSSFANLGKLVEDTATAVATNPTTNAAAASQIISDGQALAAKPISFGPTNGNIIIQREEQLDFGVTATVPLLVPSAYPGLKAQKATESASRANFDVTEAQVLYQTATSYYACAGADEVIEARQHAIAVEQKALDNAKARLDAGVVNRVEVTRAELQLVRAQQALREALDAQAQAYRSLGTIIAMHDPVRVVDTGEPAAQSDKVDELTAQALKLRPEFPALSMTIRSYDLQRQANAWKWAPTISAFGNVRAFNYTGFAGDNYAWAVGLELDWVIYDGGLRDGQRKLALAQRREQEAKLDLLRDQVSDDVYNASRNVKTKRAALDTAERSVQLSKETLDLVQVQHDAGTATQLDLLQAQDNLVAAELAVAQARFDLSLGALSLDRLSGAFPGNLNLK